MSLFDYFTSILQVIVKYSLVVLKSSRNIFLRIFLQTLTLSENCGIENEVIIQLFHLYFKLHIIIK